MTYLAGLLKAEGLITAFALVGVVMFAAGLGYPG